MKFEVDVLGSPYGLCGRKSTMNKRTVLRAQELGERRGGCPGLPVPNTFLPYGLCGRKATLNKRTLYLNVSVEKQPEELLQLVLGLIAHSSHVDEGGQQDASVFLSMSVAALFVSVSQSPLSIL